VRATFTGLVLLLVGGLAYVVVLGLLHR